jgi:hypothetical protein
MTCLDREAKCDDAEAEGNEQVPIRICRVSCKLNYLSPNKRKNVWEITFENLSDNQRDYILLQANDYLPGLKIKDSYGRNLMVVPRHLLPEDIAQEEYAMLIRLKEPIEPGNFETIHIESIRPVVGAGKPRHESHLFGYISDQFEPEIEIPLDSECSWYISIFAPKGYELKVCQGDIEAKDVYHDENSYLLRVFSKQAPLLSAIIIKIPTQIKSWLGIGTIFIFLLPLLGATAYFVANNLTLCYTMIFGTTAAILAMRAWLFYSVELLDRNNSLYLTAFIFNVAVAVTVLLFNTHIAQEIGNWSSQLYWQNINFHYSMGNFKFEIIQL